MPGVEIRHQGSALTHHDTALVTGQAVGTSIPLAADGHRFVADLQGLPDPFGSDPVSVIVMGALLQGAAAFAHGLTGRLHVPV
ncbi:MAG: hypothetical protein E6H92_02775 [Chloroflexi bacterium]|nr:MAG: hypothetical protein E6H92_02775 [Chloroflexota bacterium]